jgi:transposase
MTEALTFLIEKLINKNFRQIEKLLNLFEMLVSSVIKLY